ncbi:non-homologous end-joining DNA ligase LigD [Mesorhizobium sp. Cs1299R1N3]|uniref:non-homologous end-joining DNA ligase LigD n=1 Tax=Mesorhizobium sp. Cs1299R1N3 TaxID=3015173 RepID=UPI00301DCAEE
MLPLVEARVYLRNGCGNTAIDAFSPRARPGFPVAHLVTRTQVDQHIRPDVFTIDHPFRRLSGTRREQILGRRTSRPWEAWVLGFSNCARQHRPARRSR